MGMVSKATRERIRERIDLIQLVSEYVSLQPRGPDDFWGRCPFHEEKRPSFHVRPSKGMFKCFGCSKGGDVFRFVEEIEGVDFKEALKRCAQRANVPLDEVSPEERARDDKRAELLRALNQAAEFFTDVLWSNTPAGAKGRATLAARGVTEATAKAWRLGMAPEGWGALHQAARERKIPEQALLELGLLRRKEGSDGRSARSASSRPYDFFRDRLMFPICDDQGRVVAFGGRTLSDDERKYMNSPEVAGIYEKRRILYGLDKAKKAPKPAEGPRRLVVVEGYLDVVIPHQAGLTTFVASLGTAFTLEQAKLARRFFDEAVLLFDGDAAGQAATQRALAALVGASDLTFKVARLPEGFDPDDLVRKDLPALERCLAQADDLVGFLVAETLRGWDAASPQGRERAIKASVRLLARIESELLQTTELNVVAHRFGIPEQLLRDEIIKAKRQEQTQASQQGARDARRPGGAPAPAPARPVEVGLDAESALLEALLALPDATARAAAAGLTAATFEEGPRRQLAAALFALAAEPGNPSGQVQATDVLARVEEPGVRALAGALIGRIDATKDYARVLDSAGALLLRAQRRRLQELQRELRMTKDTARQAGLLAESKRLRDAIEAQSSDRSRATAKAR